MLAEGATISSVVPRTTDPWTGNWRSEGDEQQRLLPGASQPGQRTPR